MLQPTKYSTLNDIKKIVFVSKGAEEDFVNVFNVNRSKLVTIYNPVINNEVIEKSLEICNHPWLQKSRKYKTIVTIGRLTEQKNHELLINAFSKLKYKNTKLIILGEGKLRKNLENQINDLGLNETVDLHGFVNNPYSYLSAADLFVLSSNYEGLPTVLIEALSCGCEIVSTNCPTGPEEILENGKYGKLVPVNDEQSLIKAIDDSLRDSHKLNRNKLIKRGNEFNVENSVEKYTLLINEIME